jgi:hypothetical protein
MAQVGILLGSSETLVEAIAHLAIRFSFSEEAQYDTQALYR